MKCEAVYAHSSEFSVRKMCRALGLCEASYYQWRRGEKRRCEKRAAEQALIKQIKAVFEESNCTYGCRRMKQALEDKGIVLSEWKIRRIMRENGFYPVTIGKYRPGKRGKPDRRFYNNIIKQDFTTERMNQKWVGDITYLKTKLGWVYLAAVMDLYNREVIGYAVSKTIDAELACQALRNAIIRNGKPEELVFHSDRGSQYSSRKYQSILNEYHITGSMSNPGCPYDNSCMESFFASMKKEYISRKEYATMEAVKQDIFYYVEIFDNRKGLHSALGYQSPVSYRLQNYKKTA